ncbi:MAG: DUF6174 domain-containing protein [Chloroflexota bacterium]
MKRRYIKFTLLILGLTFFCNLLFGFTVGLPGRLEAAQARWEAQNIQNYRYFLNFGSPSAIGRVLITVSEGQVIKIDKDMDSPLAYHDPPNLTPISANPDWYIQNFSELFPSDLSNFSIEQLFDFVRDHPQPLITTCRSSEHYEASYDDIFGYVNEIQLTNCPPNYAMGILCFPTHCFTGFQLSDFEVLASPTE